MKKFARLCYGCYAWTIFVLLVLAFFVISAPLPRPRYPRRLAHRIARLLFRLAGIRLAVSGLERIPRAPHILVVNHQSFLDALVLSALLPPDPGYTFTTRQEFPSQSLLCPLLNSVHTLVLRPPGGRYSVNVELMKRALRRGHNLIVFPEGRFRTEPGLLAFHSGAFVAAAAVHVPVVVAALHGTRAALPMGTWLLRRIDVDLQIGPVIQASRNDPDAARRIQQAARVAILNMSGETDGTDPSLSQAAPAPVTGLAATDGTSGGDKPDRRDRKVPPVNE